MWTAVKPAGFGTSDRLQRQKGHVLGRSRTSNGRRRWLLDGPICRSLLRGGRTDPLYEVIRQRTRKIVLIGWVGVEGAF